MIWKLFTEKYTMVQRRDELIEALKCFLTFGKIWNVHHYDEYDLSKIREGYVFQPIYCWFYDIKYHLEGAIIGKRYLYRCDIFDYTNN